MNWPLSILIGILTAALGCFCAVTVASMCVRWYRISSFEGGSGYFVVFMGLFGILIGLVLGIVCARIAAGWADPGFFKSLGLAAGSMTGLALVVAAISRLAADLPPEIDGKSLELAIEVKSPVGFTVPEVRGDYPATARVTHVGRRSQPGGDIRLKEATQVDGRWIIPVTVPLQTSVSDKHLHFYINEANNHVFWLPLRAHPKTKDTEWSTWVEAGWTPGTEKPKPENNFLMRYRVLVVEPPPPKPPGPTQEELAAQQAAEEEAEFQTFLADPQITKSFRYTQYGTPEPRLRNAIEAIRARLDFESEFSALILGVNPDDAMNALRMLEHMQPVPKAFSEPVSEFGKHIARALERLNGTSGEPPFGGESDVIQWFSAWMVAVRAMQAKDGADLTPELHEILRQARKCGQSGQIQASITRVASYYMKEFAGVEPLPGDPPPR